MATQMLQRRGTAAQWAAANPILGIGEIGFESDTKVIKLGDGVTPWQQLSSGYVNKRGGDTITASAPGVTPIVVKGAPGQTNDLFRAETSDGVAMRVSNTGDIFRGTSRMMTTADADPLYLGKTAKAADADKLDGVDAIDFMLKGFITTTSLAGRNTKTLSSLNAHLVSGWYDGTGLTGAPNTSDWWLVEVITHSNNSTWQRQLAYSMNGETGTQSMYSRRCNGADPTLGASWSGWSRVDSAGMVSGVSSVNGRTGAVTGLSESNHGHTYPVTSVNGRTGAVTGLSESHSHPYASDSHGHSYPVTSVNGRTGGVSGLSESSHSHSANTQIVTGLYTGDGTSNRTISLGWQPNVIMLSHVGGMAISRVGGSSVYDGMSMAGTTVGSSDSTSLVPAPVSTGFMVHGNTNTSSTNYYYLALRAV